eukprot:gnl/Spiro4/13512_TR7203_c0_g1_i1.p1 gnl/Spiro4/13512_TR7203_c0_g1~~gnl/Spiro4/13512_TR7203_c0_g1_i1.p1  ORF type:complete len:767 (-),score=139.11 gnl/Spiro4/13512_TR7203_c0_g1_i1:122-2386(-)
MAQRAAEWDAFAPLTADQQSVVAALTSALDPKVLSKQTTKNESLDRAAATGSQGSWKSDPLLQSSRLDNAQHFRDWFSELSYQNEWSQEEIPRAVAAALADAVQQCDTITSGVSFALREISHLCSNYEMVARKTAAMHSACESLVQSKVHLVGVTDEIMVRLAYFDKLEEFSSKWQQWRETRVSTVPGGPIANSEPAECGSRLVEMLHAIDSCVAYLSEKSHYCDSASFVEQYQSLQAQILTFFRDSFVDKFRETTLKVLEETKVASSGSLSADHDILVLRLPFRVLAPTLSPLLAQLEARVPASPVHELLEDCLACYRDCRRMLLHPTFGAHVARLSALHDLDSLLRVASSDLLQAVSEELALWRLFFPASSDSALVPLADALCDVLYDATRPRIIREMAVPRLCELCEILSSEVLEPEFAGHASPAHHLVARPLRRILSDIQERLIFRTQTYIHDEIRSYRPSTSDLDYPAKLLGDSAEGGTRRRREFDSWYPTLDRTLMHCLSVVYRCIEKSVFEHLAHEAVAACTASLTYASDLISRKSALDGRLFLIKHLVALREQIAPFEVDFTGEESTLDFSHMKDALLSLWSKTDSFFSFSGMRRLLSGFVQDVSAPRVCDSVVDSKKNLENELKSTCEKFILEASNTLAGSLMEGLKQLASPLNKRMLSEESVIALLETVESSVDIHYPKLIESMDLYLANPILQSLMIKPIKTNISTALGALATAAANTNASQAVREAIAAASQRISRALSETS